MKLYIFTSPIGKFSKEFNSDDQALDFAGGVTDDATTCLVETDKTCVWATEYECWMPEDTYKKMKEMELQLKTELENYKAFQHQKWLKANSKN